MPYTVITDENEVRQAFEELQKDFQVDAEENGRLSFERLIYQHRRKDNLWGAFGPDQDPNRHYIGFGRGDSTIPVFMVNPPKEGDGGRQGEGLFVRDGRGNKYLTHSGNVKISGKKQTTKT